MPCAARASRRLPLHEALGRTGVTARQVGSGVVGSVSLDPLDDLFETARNNSMNTVRFFAHGINASYALQVAPGAPLVAAPGSAILLDGHGRPERLIRPPGCTARRICNSRAAQACTMRPTSRASTWRSRLRPATTST
jgi:hypothetical protein